MKGFLVDATYRVENDGTYIHLFGRLENGESFHAIKAFKLYFYIKTASKINLPATSVKFTIDDTSFVNFQMDHMSRVTFVNPQDIPLIRDLFEEKGIICYESDIKIVNRFLIDFEIQGSLDLNGPYTKGSRVDRVYLDPQIEKGNYNPKLKVLSLDIETDGYASKLYSISLFSDNFTDVLLIGNAQVEGARTFASEKELLLEFQRIVLDLDPDIITGWNFIDFDLKIIDAKFRTNGISFKIGRDESTCRVNIQTEFIRDSDASIPGRLAIDSIVLLKMSFIKLADYKLDTAAEALLGEKKLVQFKDKRFEIEQMYLNNPQLLVKYNLKDSELVYRILHEKGIIDLTIARCQLTGMLPARVKASIASLDSLYLRETRKKGIVCPSTKFDNKYARIKGGYVRDSIPGIYSNVNVFDFKSLYPSIIRTFNIDPISFARGGPIVAPNKAAFSKDEGILPNLIEQLWLQRDIAKKDKNQIKSNAIKITMNSFFGVLANPTCRFFSLDVANAITGFGQFIIKLSADKIEELGYKVIYGDTDSVFALTEGTSPEDCKRIGLKITNYVNAFYSDYVKTNYGRDSFMELQFEKTFVKFLMPKIRNVDVGAKKRYAGLVLVNGEEKIVVIGLEIVRRDWTFVAKNFQMELLDRLFHEKDLKQYIKNYVLDLKSGKLDDKLIYTKELRKNVEQYVKTTPPHVKAARLMINRDTTLINYVMTTNGPEPIENKKSPIDYSHYIEKQIRPIANAILEFYPGLNFDEIITGTSQKNLFSF